MDNTYAVFPLNIVVLPEESVALHLFEPRYRQLFKDFKDGGEFAIVHKDKNGLADFGSLVYIDKIVNEFPDETVDIIVKGSSIIQVEKFIDTYPNKLYSAIKGEIVELPVQASPLVIHYFNDYLKHSGKRIIKEHSESIFYIANRLGLSNENKNKLISLSTIEEMNNFLLNELKFLVKIREQESLLQQNFHLN